MTRYAFLLGHEPEISIAEIQAVAIFFNVKFEQAIQRGVLYDVTCNTPLDTEAWINRLGGTQKIFLQIENSKELDLVKLICNHLQQVQPEGKMVFSISGDQATDRAKNIKKILKGEERSVRFVEPKNAATVEHNNLVKKQGDIFIEKKTVWVTVALQPFADFAKRDYGRPQADSKRGMLPPKLARIMINLSETKIDAVIYDPFCGLGTVLSEALALGFTKLIGSDIDKKVISQAEENIKWLLEHENKTAEIKLFAHNAEDHSTLPKESVDCIITEPLLGNPLHGFEGEQKLLAAAMPLSKLYVNTLSALYPILKKGGTVIFIFPSFIYRDNWIPTVDLREITRLGYTNIPWGKDVFLQYHREKQFLARDIYKFKKSPD